MPCGATPERFRREFDRNAFSLTHSFMNLVKIRRVNAQCDMMEADVMFSIERHGFILTLP